MKRTVKNLVLFAVMIAALGMTVLTVLHGYGVIGGSAGGTPEMGDRDFPGENGMPERPDGGSDGEEIGEIALPGRNAQGGQAQTPPEMPDGNGQGQMPPEMPDGNGFGGGERGDGRNVTGSLGAHVAFAAVWIFLFAFCLAWAIVSGCNAERRRDTWKSEPVSSGTN